MSSPPSSAPSSTPPTATALWAYAAIEDNELSFEAGDAIAITDLCNSDWFEGSLRGRTGYFPANRVRLNRPRPEIEHSNPASAAATIGESVFTTSDDPPQASLRSSVVGGSKKQAPQPPPSRRSMLATNEEAAKRASLISIDPATTSTSLPPTPAPSLQPDTLIAPLLNGERAATVAVHDTSDPFDDTINTLSLAPAAPPPPHAPLIPQYNTLTETGGSIDGIEEDAVQRVPLKTEPVEVDTPAVTGTRASTPGIASLAASDADWDIPAHESLESITSAGGSTWKPQQDAEGDVYYWNAARGLSSWEAPVPRGNPSGLSARGSREDGLVEAGSPLVHVGAIMDNAGAAAGSIPLLMEAGANSVGEEVDLGRFEAVPADLVRKEGAVKVKVGVEKDDKKGLLGGSSWKSCIGVVVVGVLFLFKDVGSMGKSKRAGTPHDAIFLSNCLVEAVGKDVTSKKYAFMVTSAVGRRRVFHTDSDTAATSWIDSLQESMKERHTAAEYDSVTTRIFIKRPPTVLPVALLNGEVISGPIPGSFKSLDVGGKSPGGSSVASTATTGSTAARRPINMFAAKERTPSEHGGMGIKFGGLFGKKSAAKTDGTGSGVAQPRPEQIFGGLLEAQLEAEGAGRKVPSVVELCIAAVEARGGLESQGIYRLSGSSASISRWKVMFNAGEPVDFSLEDDINAITGVLKSYFRELQNPLIPYEVYEQYIASSKIGDYNERLIALKNLVQQLPPCNYHVLFYLMRHLKKVSERSEVNKMEQSNLAIVFAPTLIRTPEFVGDAAAIAQQQYASMGNMPFHNKLIESMLEQYEVGSVLGFNFIIWG
ncbi:hypothetical protein BC830DRAFT_1132800 [Chytriomyces sp. MP71]|nr:hypothetical protein BC830DRAFT_1132800 [Chytriomyces sp. MP71]